jgi:hypothetical protein
VPGKHEQCNEFARLAGRSYIKFQRQQLGELDWRAIYGARTLGMLVMKHTAGLVVVSGGGHWVSTLCTLHEHASMYT